MGNETQEKKWRKYPGQLYSIVRGMKDKKTDEDKTMVLSITDRLSHMTEDANATYLELLHPASTYQISILGDKKRGISTKANIKTEHLKLIWMRVERAEDILFKKKAGLLRGAGVGLAAEAALSDGESAVDPAIFQTDAFSVSCWLGGTLKGKTPGEVLFNAPENEKQRVLQTLQNQRDYLLPGVDKYANNKKMIAAIDTAVRLYQEGKMAKTVKDTPGTPAPVPAQQLSSEIPIYDPPEKTFRTETRIVKELDSETGILKDVNATNTYKLTISFIPENRYPYCVVISNEYAEIIKKTSGLETIRHLTDKTEAQATSFKMLLSSEEMVAMVGAMDDNLFLYKSAIYEAMRKKDEAIKYENRNKMAPK